MFYNFLVDFYIKYSKAAIWITIVKLINEIYKIPK